MFEASLMIDEDKSEDSEDYTDTPKTAVGEVVEVEIPGTMGKEPYRVIEVDSEEKTTLLENVLTGNREVVGDGVLLPDWDHMSRPPLGREYTKWWIEHQNGHGEWVRAQGPFQAHTGAARERVRYDGHENTQVVSETFKYLPDGFVEYPIFTDHDPDSDTELTVYASEEYDQLEDVFEQTNGDFTGRVGKIFIDHNMEEIVKYKINEEYKEDNHSNFVEVLDNYRI